jgi:beta-glucanase (GH16 family)
MERIVVKILMVLILFFPQWLQANNQCPNNYKLIWEDDFTSGTINTSIWNMDDNDFGGGNAEFQYYSPRNVSVEKHPSGVMCMVLSAKKENYKNRMATSGRVNTEGKLTMKYGKVDVRVHLPKTANGMWPAFWMLGDDKSVVDWPMCGEIDIIEVGHWKGIKNNTQDRYFNGACHWGASWNGGSYPNMAMHSTADYSLQDDFHLFTLVWRPDSILMYLDQDKYPEVKPYYYLSINGEDHPDSPSRYFHKPFHFIANLAVGGTFPGMPFDSNKRKCCSKNKKIFKKITALPADGSPAKMYIDYIRVYQNGTPGEEFEIKK